MISFFFAAKEDLSSLLAKVGADLTSLHMISFFIAAEEDLSSLPAKLGQT
jgi:hypothetical protein